MTVLFFLIVLSAGLPLAAPAAETRAEPPMEVLQNVVIPDGEHLVVGQYTGSQKTGEIHAVTTYITKEVVKIYSFSWIYNNKDLPLPGHYTNYDYIFTVNLKTGRMIELNYDDTDYFVKRNKNRGLFYEDCKISNNSMNAVMKFWDGDDVREKTFVIDEENSSYPFWHYMPFLLVGARIFDWDKPGLVNIWQEYVKDPFPANFQIIRKGVMIDTPLGSIKTTEVMPSIHIPLLAGILKQFTESMKLWYEEGPRRRWIMFHIDTGDQTWLLEKSEIWQ